MQTFRASTRRNGFTIVELVVVIVVIAILTTIITLGLTKYQASSRDARRASNATIIATALEQYFNKNGEYPGCPAVTANPSTVTSNTLVGIDQSALLTPTVDTSVGNSIQCDDLTSTTEDDIFAYVGDSSDECQIGIACAYWTLKYQNEEDNTIDEIQSRHKTTIATVATPTGLSVSATLVGTTARGTASGGTCQPGATLERQMRSRSTNTSAAGTWSGWTSVSQIDLAANEGYMYGFEQRGRCTQSVSASSWVSSGAQNVTRPITTIPAAVTLTVASTETTTTFTRTNATCPAGTTARYQYKYLMDTAAGYESAWYGPSTASVYSWGSSSQGYQYTTQVQAHCYTYRSTGPWSATTTASYLRPVDNPTGTATGFTHTVASDRLSRQFNWTWATCGPGTVQESHNNSYIGAGTMYWTMTGTNGWLYGASGWGDRGFWSPQYTSNMNSGTVPSGVQVQHKVQYICTNLTTGRASAWGPATTSQMFNT